MARNVRNLEVFRLADSLLFDVLARTSSLSGPGRFVLCDQLSRAALSVPVNLVEGSQRSTTREYARFVEIAAGSAAEVRYLLSVLARLTRADESLLDLEAQYGTLVPRLQALRNSLATRTDERAVSPGPSLPAP